MTTRIPFKVKEPTRRERKRTVEALTNFRREWQELASGKSLVTIKSPVGLLLSDIADQLHLTAGERLALLGGRLTHEVEVFLQERVNRTSQV